MSSSPRQAYKRSNAKGKRKLLLVGKVKGEKSSANASTFGNKIKGENMVILGDLVKDKVSGFKGIAVSKHSYLNGCDRISVQPPIDKHGKHPESITFDEPQLEVLKTKKVAQGQRITGGTDRYNDEGR